MDAIPEKLRMGDVVPGHVLIVEGRDRDGRVHLYEVRSLDEPFLGCLFPQNLYADWRFRIERREAWAEEQAAGAEMPIVVG